MCTDCENTDEVQLTAIQVEAIDVDANTQLHDDVEGSQDSEENTPLSSCTSSEVAVEEMGYLNFAFEAQQSDHNDRSCSAV